MSVLAPGLGGTGCTFIAYTPEIMDEFHNLPEIIREKSKATSYRISISEYSGVIPRISPLLELILGNQEKIRNEVTSLDVPLSIAKIRDSLDLNTSEIATVLKVSRPTIYSWTKGGNIKAVHRQRIAEVLEIADEWNFISKSPIGNLVREKVGNDPPILEILSKTEIDRSSVKKSMKAVAEKITEFQSTRGIPSAQEFIEKFGLETKSQSNYRRTVNALGNHRNPN